MLVIANWKIPINSVIIIYYKTFFTRDFQHYDIDLLYNYIKLNSRKIDCYLVNHVLSFILRQAKNIVVGKVN